MKYLTMVMRYGDLKGKDIDFQYTLIGDNMSMVNLPGAKLAEGIASKKYSVTNMDVTTKGLVSTNGALKNYTTIGLDGKMVGSPKAVILNRVEKNNELVGYVIFNLNGTVSEISVKDAATLASNGMIANGKVRHTDKGDIVASIGGTYPLMMLNTRKVVGKIWIDLALFHSVIGPDGRKTRCAGILVTSNSAETISKMYNLLEAENTKLRKKLDKIGYEDTASLSVIRGNAGGFYGVYPIETVFNLMGKAAENTISYGSIIMSCKDLSGSEPVESGRVLDCKTFETIKSQTGSDKADAELNTLAKAVKEKLSAVNVTTKKKA